MYEFVHYKSTIGTSFDTSEDVQQRFCHKHSDLDEHNDNKTIKILFKFQADTLQRRHELQHVTTRSSRSSANYKQTHYNEDMNYNM